MWRYVGSALCALLVVASCQPECDDGYYVYRCSLHYSPYYGYYEACYPVRYRCPDEKKCKGSKCDDPPPAACKKDEDCEPGQVCGTDGNCGVAPLPDGGVSVSPDASSTGGTPTDPGGGNSGGASSSGGAPAGTGAASSSGGDSTSSGGATSATGGASTGDGGEPPGAGGTSNTGGTTPGGAANSGGSSTGGGSAGRIRRFNFPCIRDTQCGAGECAGGLCFTACESDAECGTADRCSVESGRRICNPDPNPPVRCDVSADCRTTQACLNGACHDKCDVDSDCIEPQDRCEFGFCSPDRRPIAECVLNVECPTGLVCLDAKCVDLSNL